MFCIRDDLQLTPDDYRSQRAILDSILSEASQSLILYVRVFHHFSELISFFFLNYCLTENRELIHGRICGTLNVVVCLLLRSIFLSNYDESKAVLITGQY